MKKLAVIFDQDGTLFDSGRGILNTGEMVLSEYGIHVPREKMRVMVGPPLKGTLIDFGVPKDKADEAVRRFISIYEKGPQFDFVPYPGIEKLLIELKQEGNLLYVATSKNQPSAEAIQAHAGFSQYYAGIYGAAPDGTRDAKDLILAFLLKRVPAGYSPILVGDTKFDVLGAKKVGIPVIGVSWGYGNVQEMKQEKPYAIVDSVDELKKTLAHFADEQ